MKILAIGRNYLDHARELNNPVPKEPVVFLKPETALVKDNKPFFYPDFSKEIHHEVEVVLRICKVGKYIDEKFAHRYYDQLTVGIDFTARDLQRDAKEKGLPWEIAKGFDGSAPVGRFIKVRDIRDVHRMMFGLMLNDKRVQEGNTIDMIFSFERIIAYISRFFTLQMGDLIYTGTPVGVGPVAVGDHLVADIEGETLLDFYIK
ncbi:MAG: fumarylacetoacetate hydrolase family protein [Bacteroidales bacterium]|nr:fumarylacetoacetate hydrolase family protein [Bacteroidales bacterium]